MRRCSPLLLVMDPFNDWDLQAVVRSCSFAHADEPAAAAGPRRQEPAAPAPQAEARLERTVPVAGRASAAVAGKDASSRALYGQLDYLDLDRKPFLLPAATAPSRVAGEDGREVMISFPAAAVASTSGSQSTAVAPGRKAGARTTRPKRSKKSQLKKVVREMPVADGGVSSSDPWAWRKYGQKPIKGSPYPRGYYKCSSMKGCMARKLVERSPAKPGVLIVTYMADHCHPVPTQLNALAGTTRHSKPSAGEDRPASTSPKRHEQQQQGTAADDEAAAARCDADSNEASTTTTAPVAADCGGGVEELAAALADDDGEFWPAGMDLDELLAPVDDDFDFEHVLDDDDGVLGRRLSL